MKILLNLKPILMKILIVTFLLSSYSTILKSENFSGSHYNVRLINNGNTAIYVAVVEKNKSLLFGDSYKTYDWIKVLPHQNSTHIFQGLKGNTYYLTFSIKDGNGRQGVIKSLPEDWAWNSQPWCVVNETNKKFDINQIKIPFFYKLNIQNYWWEKVGYSPTATFRVYPKTSDQIIQYLNPDTKSPPKPSRTRDYNTPNNWNREVLQQSCITKENFLFIHPRAKIPYCECQVEYVMKYHHFLPMKIKSELLYDWSVATKSISMAFNKDVLVKQYSLNKKGSCSSLNFGHKSYNEKPIVGGFVNKIPNLKKPLPTSQNEKKPLPISPKVKNPLTTSPKVENPLETWIYLIVCSVILIALFHRIKDNIT